MDEASGTDDDPVREPVSEAKKPGKPAEKAAEPAPANDGFLDIVVDGEKMCVPRKDYEIHGAPDDVIVQVAQIKEAERNASDRSQSRPGRRS